jgi:2-polyprenyl-3-methyl-5-hydroxy-6-metoxy-1,4-benzoquinol methylase
MIHSMAPNGGSGGPGQTKPRALAFYLPQYHPIPENDEWWGKGFTEWTNVTKARPFFPGHYQPHVPGELGYYDLRVPEVREAQAALAAAYGISGFVYYHYWFHGTRLLERPLDEVLASGSPDFPIALCWANEEWTRNWDARSGEVLMPQQFSDEDDLAHIRWLATAFADDRYIKIDGRPLMLIYRPGLLPHPKRTAELWRTEAQRLGFPDLYLCWVESQGPPPGGPQAFGLDASVEFMPWNGDRVFAPLEGTRGHRIYDYRSAYEAALRQVAPEWKRFPSVMVGWDNTARRPRAATIFDGSTPEQYEKWLRAVVDSVSDVRAEENFLFIVAWNEWAEGNHLEPDQRYGRAYLEATKAVLLDPPSNEGKPGLVRAVDGQPDRSLFEYVYPFEHETAMANVAGLIRDLRLDEHSTVVDLGAGTAVVSYPLRKAGLAYHGLEVHPAAVELMHEAGIDATQCDLTDFDAVQSALDDIGKVGALTLLDVIEHLTQPQELLSALSAWSLKHGEPPLVVSVPNVSHFDVGLRLLCGKWIHSDEGLLDSTHLRFFTEKNLQSMLERCGWRMVARDDCVTVRSDQYDDELNDALPVEMVGALRALAESANPYTYVQRFIWTLAPYPVSVPPATYLEAVSGPVVASEGEPDEVDDTAVRTYLRSVGLISSETNRRAAKHLRSGIMWRGRRIVRNKVSESPRLSAYATKLRSWVR